MVVRWEVIPSTRNYFLILKKLELVELLKKERKKVKVIPVTGCGDPQGCETSRLPHFLDSLLTDGGEVVSLTCQLFFSPVVKQ
jgi:hypothetical protein